EGLRIKMPTPSLLDLSKLDTLAILTGPLYYYVFGLLVILAFIMWRIVDSAFGLGLRAIRENEQKAKYLGVNVQRCRLVAFVIALLCGALGRVIGATPLGLSVSRLPYWVQSGNLVFMLPLACYTNFFGPLLRAALFILFHAQFMSYTEYWRLTFGILLAV